MKKNALLGNERRKSNVLINTLRFQTESSFLLAICCCSRKSISRFRKYGFVNVCFSFSKWDSIHKVFALQLSICYWLMFYDSKKWNNTGKFIEFGSQFLFLISRKINQHVSICLCCFFNRLLWVRLSILKTRVLISWPCVSLFGFKIWNH